MFAPNVLLQTAKAEEPTTTGILNTLSNPQCHYPPDAPDIEIRIAIDDNNNCQVDPGSEKCQYDRLVRLQQCNAGTLTERECIHTPVCVENGGQWSLDFSGNPYDIEYFDVTDTEKGLKATENQGARFAGSGDPEVGTTQNVIMEVMNFLVSMISLLALLVFIAGVFFLVTASGDDQQIQKGKDAIKYSLIGIVFVMLSYTIVIFIQSILF
jgi:hypothetical protein